MTRLGRYQDELSRCSKCGLCQAFCPVYAVTGVETMTARGRNAQLMGVIEGKLPLFEIEDALSSCLLCRACVPSCFSGVKTDEIVRGGREAMAEARGVGVLKSLIFNKILPYPERMAFFLKAAFLMKWAGLAKLSRKLRIADALIKNPPKSFLTERLKGHPAGSLTGKRRVAYFLSCGFNYLLPETGEATIKVIERLGYEVVASGNNCCGLPPYAYGDTKAAKKLAKSNIVGLERFETILTECGSCSSFLKKYAEIMSDDPEYAERAKSLSERVVDSNEFIFKHMSTGTAPSLRPSGELMARNSWTAPSFKVTYHDPCHLSRHQGITRDPREIIRSIPGTEFIELPEADWCCGGAGTYSITNNRISMNILDRKIENVKKTGAGILATSCPACMIQLSHGLRLAGLNIRVLHVNQLLAGALRPT